MQRELPSMANPAQIGVVSTAIQSEKLFQITEQNDHLNEKQRVFLIKIVVSPQMRGLMQSLQASKKQRLKRLQAKQKNPELQMFKQKWQQYSKLDGKGKEQYRRRNENISRQLAEYELHIQLKEKYSFPIFEGFEMRGKSPHIKYFYSPEKRFLAIKINKRYFLEELHLSHKELFNTPITFARTWNIDFYLMVKVLWKLYGELEKAPNFVVYIRSLDLISITFDVQYFDKRIYRFRYSPFEFKLIPNFKEDNQLTGYFQILSCIPEVGSLKGVVVDSDFYSNYRLFFFDDLTDGNIFFKIFNRCNLFYQVYSLSKGNLILNQGNALEPDEFLKKCQGHFYFSTTRLKKFIFTWAFKQYRRASRKKEENEAKEIVLHTPFYFDVERECKENHPVVQTCYRLKLQLLDASHLIAYNVREEIAQRVKEWYYLYKEVTASRDRNAHEQERPFRRHQPKGDSRERQDQEDFEMHLSFGAKDRLDKFFMGFIVIVSTVLDRHFFAITQDKLAKREDVKRVRLQTQETVFCNKKHEHMKHLHSVHVVLAHSFLPQMGQSSARREDKLALEAYLAGKGDFRIKCGEWRLQGLLKVRRRLNIKNEKDTDGDETDVVGWPEVYRNYIGILTRHFPLRLIYNDILHFVEQIARTCYGGQEDTNAFELNKMEGCYRSLIGGLINYYYYSQFKDKLPPKEDKPLVDPKDELKAKFESEKAKMRQERLEDAAARVVVIHILTKGNVGFMPEEKLLAEITFRLMEFRQIWQTTVKEGFIVLRLFEDRVDFEKEYVVVHSLKYDRVKRVIDEQAVRAGLEMCAKELRASLAL